MNPSHIWKWYWIWTIALLEKYYKYIPSLWGEGYLDRQSTDIFYKLHISKQKYSSRHPFNPLILYVLPVIDREKRELERFYLDLLIKYTPERLPVPEDISLRFLLSRTLLYFCVSSLLVFFSLIIKQLPCKLSEIKSRLAKLAYLRSWFLVQYLYSQIWVGDRSWPKLISIVMNNKIHFNDSHFTSINII